MVLPNQLLSLLLLVRRRLPRRIKDFIARANVLLRILMTIQAPPHVQSLSLARQRHLIDPPMTIRAADSFCDVNAVIEIDVVRQVIHPCPFQRFPSGETFANRRQHWRVGPQLRMAGHARFSRWNPRKRRLLHRRVAVAAIYPVVGNMMLMAKWDRLLQRDIDLRRIWRPVNNRRSPTGSACQHHNADNNNPSMDVGAFRKKLGHNKLRLLLRKRESRMQADRDACNDCGRGAVSVLLLD